jgi:hypothetical protein
VSRHTPIIRTPTKGVRPTIPADHPSSAMQGPPNYDSLRSKIISALAPKGTLAVSCRSSAKPRISRSVVLRSGCSNTRSAQSRRICAHTKRTSVSEPTVRTASRWAIHVILHPNRLPAHQIVPIA